MAKKLTKDQLSTLLYLETRAVDHAGRVDCLHLNADDMKICEKWKEDGFIRFGRIRHSDVIGTGTLWVEFTEDAWQAAHAERRARAARMFAVRTYETTDEKRAKSC